MQLLLPQRTSALARAGSFERRRRNESASPFSIAVFTSMVYPIGGRGCPAKAAMESDARFNGSTSGSISRASGVDEMPRSAPKRPRHFGRRHGNEIRVSEKPCHSHDEDSAETTAW